jgi:ADP-L-glycero-D-manno-heptose 6-epimerase
MPGATRPNYQNFTEARMQKLCGTGYDQPFTLMKDGVGRYMESYVATCDRNR